MDPISAFGVAGGAVQLGDIGVRGLIGMVQLLRRLKETPKEMRELLHDVEKSVPRICELQNTMSQPSPLFTYRSGTQVQRLMTVVNDAHQAAIDLQQSLKPLFSERNVVSRSWIKRTWVSVVSASMQSTIAQKVARIERLDREIASELQLAGLNRQAKQEYVDTSTCPQRSLANQLREVSTQLHESVESLGRKTASQLDLMTVSNEAIGQSLRNSCFQHSQSLSDIVSMQDETHKTLGLSLDQIENGRQHLHATIESAHSNLLSSSRHGHDGIMAAVQNESSHTRADIASLRDLILELMTQKEPTVGANRSINSQLTQQNAGFARSVGEQLLHSPSTLKEVCEKTTRVNQVTEGDCFPQNRAKMSLCNCAVVRERATRRSGPFGITYDFKSAHAAQCPYYQSQPSSWSYFLSVQLLPIVQKTVGIAFAANYGAGGGSIGPSLRYFGTVERLKSPGFQLFDRFLERCADRYYGPGAFSKSGRGNIYVDSQSGHPFGLVWDMKLLEAEIPKLSCDLSSLLSTDRALACCSDENGNTLLHVSI